jgi:hypothetical protein
MASKYPILRPNDIIPIHDTVARGTLKSILLQAGIELEDFLKLL